MAYGNRGRQQYDNNNSGALFENDRANGDKDPHMKGSAEVDGIEYWVAGWWTRPNKGGDEFLKIRLTPKDEGGGGGNNRGGGSRGANGGSNRGSGGYGSDTRGSRGAGRGGNDSRADNRGRDQGRGGNEGGGGGFDEMDDDIPF